MQVKELKLKLVKWHNHISAKKGLDWEDTEEFRRLINSIDELDRVKPEKVVIPKFVADWLGKSARECDYEPIRMAEWIADNIDEGTDYHFDWLENPDNQRLLLTALINNYEIEKESKYRIKLPGLAGSNGQQYISKSADGTLFACAQRNYLQQEFTGDELKQLPDWVRRLELEEVEDE